MNITHVKKSVIMLFVLAGILTQTIPTARTTSTPAPPPPQNISITPTVPSDIAPPATLQSAGAFAWQEFIALNWPAVPQSGAVGTREKADK